MPVPIQGGYTPQEFQQWYQSQYQTDPSAGLYGRIGATVGGPSANGQYSQDQWQQAQQIAQQENPGFFGEFEAPTYEAGPAYQQGPAFEAGPEFNAGPAYQSTPMYQTPEAFQYQDFTAPTAESVQADPGYQFALQQGTAGIMGNKAAAGLARTGGTLKDLMNYGQGAATQYYNDAYNRQANTYGMNRANAAENYSTNYNIGRTAWTDREAANQASYGINQQAQQGAYDRNQDARRGAWDRNTAAGQQAWTMNQAAREGEFDRNYKGATDQFNSRFAGRQATFEDLYRRWRDKTTIEAQRELAK